MNFTSLLQDGIYEVGNGAIVTDQSPYLGITPDYQCAYGFPTHPWGIFFQVVGAILVFGAYLPAVIKVLISKRTENLAIGMWIISIAGLGLLAIFAWLGVSVNPGGFILVALSETLSCIASIIVFALKIANKAKAKAAGMTELEYCNLHYPIVKKLPKR